MLELDRVSKTYRVGAFGRKELRAVEDVTFDVRDREVVSLIGESGSGKSTIGKMILGLISVTSGTIWFDGIDLAKLGGRDRKEYYRKVQGVFQDPFSSFNPIFKADRIFRIIGEEFFPKRTAAEWDRKVKGALEGVGLNPEHVLDKYPHQLSGGQLQRFLIARALLLDIGFLVADEIISMLDASTRIDVLNLLADLKGRGLSVLFITHDLSLGYYISERAVILYQGVVVEMGPTETVYDNPLHPYTMMLMASVPRLDRRWTEVGSKPADRQTSGPSGCVYYSRCERAKPEVCGGATRPLLVEAGSGHFVACSLCESGSLKETCDVQGADRR